MATSDYVNTAKEKAVKSAPYVFARFIRFITYGIFVVVRFLGQVLRDAIGR